MKNGIISIVAMLALLGASSAPLMAKEENAITEGRLEATGPDGKALGPCPLKHTDVKAEISGMVARVTVTQQFHNPFKDKIEAVYVFPLHQDSAVDEMTMKVGNRLVKGEIKERGEARRIYDQAKSEGKVASLLDQERPNIFTQSVANIEPGEEVTITIAYSQNMKWEDGRFSFDFPMVVGPRYIPGGNEAEAPKRSGDEKMPSFFRDPNPKRGPEGEPPVVNPEPAEPTDQVPDADRITPPVVEEGFRAGHDLSLTVSINAGRPIQDLESELHKVEVEHPEEDPSRLVVRLAKKAVIPNRDFVLTYRTAGEGISDAVLTHTDERGKFFTLILEPPARVQPEQIVPRELVFVVDTSGSMNGFPIETSKAMMRRAIENLRPDDRFNLVTFAGNTAVLFDQPVANTEENRHRALRFIDSLKGAGGTEMMKAINVALGGEHDPGSVRIVCFLTDGYIGNDMAIVGAVKDHARTTRVFSFGIGRSVNRFLMDAMARAGRGEAQYVLGEDQAREAAEAFYERIDAPVLTDLALSYEGVEVDEVYPRRLEDLFSAKPVIVKGRYKDGAKGVIKLSGVNADGEFEREIPVNLPAENPDNAVLASQWARARVDDLMMQDMGGAQRGSMDEDLKKKIIDLGLTYNLLTQFTSFVAVEELRITEGGKPRTIRVPVEMPDGVSYEGVFGNGQVATRTRRGGALFAPAPMAMPAGTPAPTLSGKAVAGYAIADAAESMETGERMLTELEKQRRAGELTPEEQRQKLLPLKLEASLLKRAEAGGDKPVEVRVELREFSDKTIAKLEAVGFKVLAKATSVKVVIGTIPVGKLETLALLEAVRHVDPVASDG